MMTKSFVERPLLLAVFLVTGICSAASTENGRVPSASEPPAAQRESQMKDLLRKAQSEQFIRVIVQLRIPEGMDATREQRIKSTQQALLGELSSAPHKVLRAYSVTPAWLAMVGYDFELGRNFREEEGVVGQDRVIILSNKIWRQRFNADRDIIGKPIRIDGQPSTVVGVLTAGPGDRLENDAWVPLAMQWKLLTFDANGRATNFPNAVVVPIRKMASTTIDAGSKKNEKAAPPSPPRR